MWTTNVFMLTFCFNLSCNYEVGVCLCVASTSWLSGLPSAAFLVDETLLLSRGADHWAVTGPWTLQLILGQLRLVLAEELLLADHQAPWVAGDRRIVSYSKNNCRNADKECPILAIIMYKSPTGHRVEVCCQRNNFPSCVYIWPFHNESVPSKHHDK